MAESNKRKIADPIDLSDEDPFAELTRIMGFDPRLTARSQPANEPGEPAAGARPAATPVVAKPVASEPTPAAEAAAHDDFGIDLEKELMGEFAEIDPAPTAAELPVQSVVATEADHGVDLAIDDDFENALNASLEEDAVAAALAITDDPSPAAVAQAAHPYAESDDDDAAFDDALTVDIEAEFDHSPELDLAPEFELDDLDLSEPYLDEAPVEAELPSEALVPARTQAPVVPVADALAEVDMDFSSAFAKSLRADDGSEDQVVAQSPALEPSPAYHAAEPMVASADPLDLSLEEELNAMLEGAHAELDVSSPAVTLEAEPAPRAAPGSDDARSSAIGSDHEKPVESVAAPVATAPEPRRPFIDPAIVGRLASFKAVSPRQADIAPEPEPKPEADEDLDDLLDAMENGDLLEAMEDGDLLDEMEDRFHSDDAPAEPRQENGYTGSSPVESSEAAYAYYDTAPAADPSAVPVDGHEEEALADHDPVPDVETIDVPEMAVAVADDLDIPELAYEQDEPASPAYDDIDADYPKAFAETRVTDEPVTQISKKSEEPIDFNEDFDKEFERLYHSASAFEKGAAAPSTHDNVASADDGNDVRTNEFDEDEYDTAASGLPADRDRFVDLDFDSGVEEEIALPSNAALPAREAPQRRGLLIAAVVGGVALLGGVGALALSFGNGDGTAVPVVVKADNGPIKVKPENPGGTSVPNQDNKVYDAVKGTDGAAPAGAQERLVTTSEEPVDMAAVDETANDLPGVMDTLPRVTDEDAVVAKAEDRVDPAANTDGASAEGIAVAPRRVKTMVVRADGTLAPREDPATSAPIATASTETAPADAAAAETTATVAAPAETEMAAAPDVNDETSAVSSAQPAEPTFQSPGGDTVPVKAVTTDTNTTDESTASVPDTGPAVEARPTEQPADVVADVKPEPVAPEQVALAKVEPAAIATGAWSVQIASQPSAESAKSTYEDLARRYGGVIGGRGVNIIKAEIAGKGTYWRVRVPAQSRNDAIKLCTDYKSAGGNCFVSK